MKNIVGMTAVLAATSGMALAADFNAQRTGFDGRGGITVTTNAGTDTVAGGHIQFTYDGAGAPAGKAKGQFAGSSFWTFCIELDQFASQQMKAYDIVAVKDAPDPSAGGANPNAPSSYGYGIESAIHEVVAAAISLMWIESDLSLGAQGNTDRLAAIQGEIWRAIYGNASYSNGNVSTAATTLNGAIVAGARVSGLRAMTNPTSQDMLYVVPLPPAAFAGLATIFGIAGVARLRRR